MGKNKRHKSSGQGFEKSRAFKSSQEFGLKVEPDYASLVEIYLDEGSAGLISAIQQWLSDTGQIYRNEPPAALTNRLNQVSMTVYSMAAKQTQFLASQSPKLAEFILKIPIRPGDFGDYAPVKKRLALATEAMRLINSGYFDIPITFLINSNGDAVKTLKNHVVVLYMGTNAALEIIDAACALVKLKPFEISTYAGEQRHSITSSISKKFSPLASKIHDFRINQKGANKFPCLSLLSMVENKSTGAISEFRKHYTAQGGNQLVIPGYSASSTGVSCYYPPMDILGQPSNVPVIRGFDAKPVADQPNKSGQVSSQILNKSVSCQQKTGSTFRKPTMEELTGNFKTASECEAFHITANILDETLQKANAQGREYAWSPLDDDYWLAEKSDFDYEVSCPNFITSPIKTLLGVVLEVGVFAVFEEYQGYQNFGSSFARVFQVKGKPDLKELEYIAKMYAYLRFSSRDYDRELDRKFWSNFLTKNAVSNETVLIFREDKNVAQTWAQRTFPNNSFNAWIGKCGEFVFAGWAAECRLPVSRVDLKPHEQGDEYDFSHETILSNPNGSQTMKLDIKAFQMESGKSRDWWHVSERCLRGERAQDLIVFVVIDEDFRMGKVVGYLTPNEIIDNCNYVGSHEYFGSRGYFKVYLDELKNPYYLRCIIDSQNQAMSGLFLGQDPHEIIEEMVKGYPLDPITAYRTGRDWTTAHRGGMTNLMAPCSLEMFCRPNM